MKLATHVDVPAVLVQECNEVDCGAIYTAESVFSFNNFVEMTRETNFVV